MSVLQRQLTRAAKEGFGVTDNIGEAGYLTPDGDWLDLSGRNEGYTGPTQRNLDHRNLPEEVCAILDDELGTPETTTERMRQFIEWGQMLRWSPESWGFSVYQPPTRDQLGEIVRRFRDDDEKPFFTVYGEWECVEISYPRQIRQWTVHGIDSAIDRAIELANERDGEWREENED